MRVIDKVALIYVRDGKVLSTLEKGKTTYYFPGGKRKDNETDEETLIRECKEELTIDIKSETINYYGTYEAQAHGKEEGVKVKMTCYIADFDGEVAPNSEIEKLVWLDYSDMDKISGVDKKIFEDLYQKNMING